MPTLAEAQGSPADAKGATDVGGSASPPAAVAKPAAQPPPAAAKPPQPAPAAAPDPAKPETPKPEDKRPLDRIATLSREAREERKAREAAEARAKSLEAEAKVLAELKTSKDPRKAIKELGLTFEQIVDAFAEVAPTVDPVKEIEKLRADLDAKAKADEDAKKKAEADAVAAEVRKAEGEAANNIMQQIKAAPERWEILSRLPDAGEQALEAFKLLRQKAIADGSDIPSDQVGPILLEVLDALEVECDKIGQRYRKTGQAKAEQVSSEPTGQRGTLADRQSERVPPKTIDPSISEGGILMRAQQAIADNSSEAVRARMKATLRDRGVRILQR